MNYNETWKVMNDLEDSFNKISTVDFLSEKLNDAVNSGNQQDVVDISHALLAFLPVYQKDFDEKFQIAWKKTVVELHKETFFNKIGLTE
jgi:hypothetical protein